jgi:outer membrane protein assembly factor BamB
LREVKKKWYDWARERGGMKRYFLFLLLPLSLSCSLFRGKVAPYPSGLIFPLAEAQQVSYEGKTLQSIQKSGGEIYFSTDTGLLFCLDSSSPNIKWTFTADSPFGCPPSVGPEAIFIWDQANTVYCLDKKGTLRWKKTLREKISSPPSWDQENVYVGTQEKTFLAMSQSSGESLWQLKAGGAFEAGAIFWKNKIIVGCTDGKLYFLNRSQDIESIVDIGSPIRVTPLLDGDRLYFGAEDFTFQCFDLIKKKTKWKIKAGGNVLLPPHADEARVFFFASNSVLYCLNKRGGDILWWWIVPSRNVYDLELAADKVLVTPYLSVVIGLDRKTGKEIGKYDAKRGMKSNPVWDDPYVVVGVYDDVAKKGFMLYLGKEVRVKLTPSLSSPQPPATEITFTASAVGFYLPRYEFSLRDGEVTAIVQAQSGRNSWVWYPEREGEYTIKVKVVDQKQTKEFELPYTIVAKNEK